MWLTADKSTAGRRPRPSSEASGLSLRCKRGTRTSKYPPLPPSSLQHFPPPQPFIPSPNSSSSPSPPRFLPSPTLPYPHFLFSPLPSRLAPLSSAPFLSSFAPLHAPPPRPSPLPCAHLPHPSPPPHSSPPLQLRDRGRHVPSPARPLARPSFAGNPGDVTTRCALLRALSRKDAKAVTCPERQRGCAQGGGGA